MPYSKEDIEAYARRKSRGRVTTGFDHFKRVYELAKVLAKQYDDEVLHAAAYLHEIEEEGHDASARHAKKLLKDKLEPHRVHNVEHAILHHVLDGQPKSVEAVILHDAELLDYLGIIGILRLAFEIREGLGKEDLPEILTTLKAFRKKIERSFILNQSKHKAADKLMFMDLAIAELEKELK